MKWESDGHKKFKQQKYPPKGYKQKPTQPPYPRLCCHMIMIPHLLRSSLGSRREAFLSQNIRTCMCSFTLNPAFHQNSKIFSYNLALPLIYCSLGSRREAFLSQKISGLVCVVSHLILLSTKTARYSVIIWPSLWFTVPSLWFTVGQHSSKH